MVAERGFDSVKLVKRKRTGKVFCYCVFDALLLYVVHFFFSVSAVWLFDEEIKRCLRVIAWLDWTLWLLPYTLFSACIFMFLRR